MITWMTRASYGKTASDLDTVRISRVMDQSMLIFDKLTGIAVPSIPDHHPVLDMWRGYEFALGIYGMMLNMEFTFQRGYAHHECFRFYYLNIKELQKEDPGFCYEGPPWLRDAAVLKSHRSNLQRLVPDDYKDQWKVAPKNWPYIWPRIDDTPEGYSLWISKADKKSIGSGKLSRPDPETMKRIVNWP